MFGNDPKKVAIIEARVEWLTACAVIIVQAIGALFHLTLPPPPKE